MAPAKLESKSFLPEGMWLGHRRHASGSNDLSSHDPDSPPSSIAVQENKSKKSLDTLPQKGRSPALPLLSKKPTKSQDFPPTPPAKDDYSSHNPFSNRDSVVSEEGDGALTHLRSRNISRTGSIYSISRVSFSNQISQLTSIKLPEAASISESITSINSSSKAARALNDAAEQIQSWIQKASDVLDGLDAGDDAEWAAAAGRDGIDEVDKAINHFESLIQVYIEGVEGLQLRDDAAQIPTADMRRVVDQLERIAKEWNKIKETLDTIKKQVELAMEWEEFRNTVFEDIGREAEVLSRMIFEMEERRHKVNHDEAADKGPQGIDLAELETIVEEVPGASATQAKKLSTRHSSAPNFMSPNSPLQSPNPLLVHEDTNLLGLFARMQPLRASLDFLPIRLSTFQSRAKYLFPSACNELDDRRDALELQWKKLEGDAEALRRELGEDRWLLVFRNAGKQALRMIDSVSRSVTKLDETLDSNTQLRHAPKTVKMIENYEAKKIHYNPAIERVIAIVERGVKDRLTVNGEILRLQTDIQQKWRATLADVREMDSTLNAYDKTTTEQLRDSVSTVLSSDHSFLSSTVGSRGSSPASSIRTPSRSASGSAGQHEAPAGLCPNGRPRAPSSSGQSKPATPANKRHSSLPVPSSTPASSRLPRKTPVTRSSAHESARSASWSPPKQPSPSSPSTYREKAASTTPSRPPWNYSTNSSGAIGHNFRPMAATDVSPYRKVTPPRAMSTSKQNTPSTAGSAVASRRTSMQNLSPGSLASGQRPVSKQARRMSSQSALGQQGSHGPSRPQTTLATSRPSPRVTPKHTPTNSGASASSRVSSTSKGTPGKYSASPSPSSPYASSAKSSTPGGSRPSSSLTARNRSSMLPQPRSRLASFSSNVEGDDDETVTLGSSGRANERMDSASTVLGGE